MFVGDYAFIPPAVARSNNIDADGNLGAFPHASARARLRASSHARFNRPVGYRPGSRISSNANALKRVPKLREISGKTLRSHLRGVADDGYTDVNRDGYGQYELGYMTAPDGLGFWEALLAPITGLIQGRQNVQAAHVNADAQKAANDAMLKAGQLNYQTQLLKSQTLSNVAKLALPVAGIAAGTAVVLSIMKRRSKGK